MHCTLSAQSVNHMNPANILIVGHIIVGRHSTKIDYYLKGIAHNTLSIWSTTTKQSLMVKKWISVIVKTTSTEKKHRNKPDVFLYFIQDNCFQSRLLVRALWLLCHRIEHKWKRFTKSLRYKAEIQMKIQNRLSILVKQKERKIKVKVVLRTAVNWLAEAYG